MKRFVLFILVLLGAGIAERSLWAAFTVPPAGEAVTDAAGILSPATERELDRLLRAIWRDGGSQLAVVTVPDLGGLPIEQAALKIAEDWQLGTKKDDQGMIFLIAPRDRRMRIEVGQGREGDLPDAIAKRIISEVVTPYFQRGDFDGGVRAGTLAILQRTDPERLAKFAGSTTEPPPPEHHPLSLGEWIVLGLLLFFLLGTPPGRALLFFWLMSGGRGGGGNWGGGGGGRDRYGGGGGGFSGGGASGSW